MGRKQSFLGLAIVAAALWVPGVAHAATRCEPTARAGIERCVSGLPRATIDAMAQVQRASQWCWAASISMVLRSHGVDVSQEQIVREHFGATADVPVASEVITALLDRSWRDGRGRVAHMAADSVPANEARLASADVLDDMDDERPVVLVLPRHAVVLVQVAYERTVDAGGQAVGEPRVLEALVLDPRADTPRKLRPGAAIVHMTRSAGEKGSPLADAAQAAGAMLRR